MTPLRQRMLEDLQLRGFSPRTQEAYVRAVRQLAAHFHRPPDQLGEEHLREYFLYLTNVKHFARASFTIEVTGIWLQPAIANIDRTSRRGRSRNLELIGINHVDDDKLS